MSNYDKYSYSRTLQELDDYYNHDTEPVNYAHVMINMMHCKTIDQCVQVWKSVFTKYVSLTGITELTGHEAFVDDLNSCLNENLLRLMESNNELTPSYALECLANMRECPNLKSYQKKWQMLTSQLNFSSEAEDIICAQEEYEKYRYEYLSSHYEQGTNGYKRVHNIIEENLDVLKSYGYMMLPYDVKLVNPLVNKLVAGLLTFALVVILGLVIMWFGDFDNLYNGIFVFLGLLGVGYWFVKLLKWRN